LSHRNRLEPVAPHSQTNEVSHEPQRPLISVASPFLATPGTVHLAPPRHETNDWLVEWYRGESNIPFILDTAGMRHLYFDLAAVQSSMRLDEPNALVTAYARKMMAFLLFNRAPRHILMIGLGGGSLVKFCHRHLPSTQLTVVEINPDIVALRESFYIPPDDERLQVIVGDGGDFVRNCEWTADVLLIDAFDHAGVAPSLASRDFYARAFRCLSSHGVLVMNLAGERGRYVAHLEQLRETCPGPVLLVPVEDDGNVLIFAFARTERAWTSQVAERAAEELQHDLELEFPRFLQRLRMGHLL